MEASILLWVQEHIRNPILTPIMKMASTAGDKGILWMSLVFVLLILARITAVHNKKTGETDNPFLNPGIVCLISLLSCFIIVNLILKPWVNRIRPYDMIRELIVLTRKPGDASFPSGHSSAAFAVATALYLSLPKGKRLIAVPALILASLTAFSRIYLGVHYPTDVLGGMILGILCAFGSWMWFEKKKKTGR